MCMCVYTCTCHICMHTILNVSCNNKMYPLFVLYTYIFAHFSTRVASAVVRYCFFFVLFFQGDQNTIKQKKKLFENRHIQCKQAAYTSILIQVGNGRHVNVRARPCPSRSAWAENITNAWRWKNFVPVLYCRAVQELLNGT